MACSTALPYNIDSKQQSTAHLNGSTTPIAPEVNNPDSSNIVSNSN